MDDYVVDMLCCVFGVGEGEKVGLLGHRIPVLFNTLPGEVSPSTATIRGDELGILVKHLLPMGLSVG
ncbi:hypothetical protein ES703_42704 [subsurface metagenome]